MAKTIYKAWSLASGSVLLGIVFYRRSKNPKKWHWRLSRIIFDEDEVTSPVVVADGAKATEREAAKALSQAARYRVKKSNDSLWFYRKGYTNQPIEYAEQLRKQFTKVQVRKRNIPIQDEMSATDG